MTLNRAWCRVVSLVLQTSYEHTIRNSSGNLRQPNMVASASVASSSSCPWFAGARPRRSIGTWRDVLVAKSRITYRRHVGAAEFQFGFGGVSDCDLPDGMIQGLGDHGVDPGTHQPWKILIAVRIRWVRLTEKNLLSLCSELFCDSPLFCIDALSSRDDNN